MKALRKALGIVLSLSMVLSLLTAGASAAEFPDMPTGWSHEAMEAAVENGLVSGDDTGKLNPQGQMSRAQMATVIARAFGTEEGADISGFSDVAPEAWYHGFLAKAVHMGVFAGTDDGRLLPEKFITRQEAFVVLARALNLPAGNKTTLAKFADADQLAPWAAEATAAMVEAGHVAGADGKLLPQDTITREQFAQMMHSIFKQYVTKPGTYTDVAKGSVMVNAPDVTLKNVTVTGDLVIGDGVGNGDVTLNNVTVEGRLVVRGGGVNSIHIINSDVGQVIVSKVDGNVRIVADKASEVEVITIADGKDDVIVEGKVGELVVAADVPVVVKDATVGTLDVMVTNADVSLTGKTAVTSVKVAEEATDVTITTEKGSTIKDLDALTDVTVTGDGAIENITGNVTDEKGEAVKPTEPSKPTGGGGGGSSHTHTWDDGVITKEATCSAEGIKTFTCTKDPDHTKTEPIAKIPHTEVIDEAVEPSCTETGLTEGKHCSVCNEVIVAQTVLPTAPHTPGDWETTLEATCTTEGTQVKKCTVCQNVVDTQVIATLPHDFTGSYQSDANGHWHKCANCDATDAKVAHTYNTTNCAEAATCTVCSYEKPAGDHTWDEGVVTKDPTCTEPGSKTVTCTACQETEVRTLAALDHDYAAEYTTDVKATCTEKGSKSRHCTRCDAKTDVTEIPTTDHTEVIDPAVEATCTQPGLTEGKHCSACDTVTVPQAETPLAPHDFSGAYLNDENQHWHQCANCEATDTKVNHDWDQGVVTTPPTETETGLKTYTCNTCGRTKTEVLPAEGQTTLPAVTDVYFSSDEFFTYLNWTAPADTSNISYYEVSVSADGGATWTVLCANSDTQTVLPDFYLGEGTYKIKVKSCPDWQSNFTETEYIAEDCSLTVTEGVAKEAVTVTFTPVTDGYQYSISGLTADVDYAIILSDNQGFSDFNPANGTTAKGDGTDTGTLGYPNLNDMIANGYYLVREYTNVVVGADGKTCSYTVTDCGTWTKCTP